MSVRSERLVVANTSPASSEKTVYVVASGITTLVKGVNVAPAGVPVPRVVVWVQSGPTRVSLLDRALTATEFISQQPWIAMRTGDTIGIYSEGGIANVWVSGAELIGTADQ